MLIQIKQTKRHVSLKEQQGMGEWMDTTQFPYLQIFKLLKLQFKPCEAALHSFQTPLVKLLCLTIFTARVYQDTTFHLRESLMPEDVSIFAKQNEIRQKKISISILLPGAGHCFPWLVKCRMFVLF